jgi:DNA-nicking Smr family endonuclease
LFERELAGVQPWRRGADRISAVDFENLPVPVAKARPLPATKPATSPDLHVEQGPEGGFGAAFGVSKELIGELRRGHLGFAARCDLHKLRAEAARRKLQVFIDGCVCRSLRTGLVICGRGLHSGPEGPVLARIVTEVLGRSPTCRHILAFAPAAAEQGGRGAIAILFRRSEPEKS